MRFNRWFPLWAVAILGLMACPSTKSNDKATSIVASQTATSRSTSEVATASVSTTVTPVSSASTVDRSFVYDEHRWDDSIADAFGPPGPVQIIGYHEPFPSCTAHATLAGFSPDGQYFGYCIENTGSAFSEQCHGYGLIDGRSDRTIGKDLDWDAIKKGLVPMKGAPPANAGNWPFAGLIRIHVKPGDWFRPPNMPRDDPQTWDNFYKVCAQYMDEPMQCPIEKQQEVGEQI